MSLFVTLSLFQLFQMKLPFLACQPHPSSKSFSNSGFIWMNKIDTLSSAASVSNPLPISSALCFSFDKRLLNQDKGSQAFKQKGCNEYTV